MVRNINLIPLIPKRKVKKQTKAMPKKHRLILKKRYVVEAYFGWMDQYRRLILRYDQKVNSYENFLYLASSCLLVNRLTKVLTY